MTYITTPQITRLRKYLEEIEEIGGLDEKDQYDAIDLLYLYNEAVKAYNDNSNSKLELLDDTVDDYEVYKLIKIIDRDRNILTA